MKKNLVVRVADSELDYGADIFGLSTVSKREALQAYSTGYMQGVTAKKNTTYKGVQSVKFVSGQVQINRRIKR